MAQTFDEVDLLQRVDNDLDFLAETVQMLNSDGPRLVEWIRQAVAAGNAPAVAQHAHRLKGMISNFAATETLSCAAEIEKVGKSGDLTSAPAAVEALAEQMETLITELRRFIEVRADADSGG